MRETSGKVLGVITKTETMKQLVKQRVTATDPIRNLVQRELRNVSTAVSLDELARILARNKFALVNKTKWVTTSDLLKKVCPSASKGSVFGGSSDGGASSTFRMAAAAASGMVLAGVGTFLAMKNKQA